MKIRIWIGIGSLSGGGAETQVNLLANGLPKDRFEVRIGYVSKSQYDPPASSDFTRKYFGRKYRYDWLSVWFGVARDIRKFEPDIVHLWLPDVITIPGVILSRLHGIPVITSIRRSTFKGIPLSQYCREFLGLFPHSISKCIVTNFDIKEEPFWVRKLCSLRNHTVIPNGVDIYRQGSEYVSKSHNKSLIKLIFVGRFAKQKHLPFLLKALWEVRNRGKCTFTLSVFGRGTKAQEEEV